MIEKFRIEKELEF